jgi:hypothetical protein
MSTDPLPQFSLDSYEDLLSRLRRAGYDLRPIFAMRDQPRSRTVYLRHDIDLHLLHVDCMADREARLGISSTYFVAVSQHYNVLTRDNIGIVRRLVGLGHEVGLHYDLASYPTEPGAALGHLQWEVSVLERATAAPVQSICMHQPHMGGHDPFLINNRWLNPHDPRVAKEMVYISDSCRAWRDTSLLLLCRRATRPARVMLNTHPELWLDGTIENRERYLEEIVMRNAVQQTERYLSDTVRGVWRTHAAGRAHDAREATARGRVCPVGESGADLWRY